MSRKDSLSRLAATAPSEREPRMPLADGAKAHRPEDRTTHPLDCAAPRVNPRSAPARRLPPTGRSSPQQPTPKGRRRPSEEGRKPTPAPGATPEGPFQWSTPSATGTKEAQRTHQPPSPLPEVGGRAKHRTLAPLPEGGGRAKRGRGECVSRKDSLSRLAATAPSEREPTPSVAWRRQLPLRGSHSLSRLTATAPSEREPRPPWNPRVTPARSKISE